MTPVSVADYRPDRDALDAAADWWDVSEFPSYAYSNRAIGRVGDALKGDLIWTDETAKDIMGVFQVANSWLGSHLLPMNRVRAELVGKVRRHGLNGLTVARLKNMDSVRRKLRNHAGGLNQIWDLGGCRVIVPSIADAKVMVGAQRKTSKHEFAWERDYINGPKPDGYRSHHLVFKFVGGPGEEAYDGRRIEVQIRTRLQHSWATAVEAVGLFRKEDLKGGFGNDDWRRLFLLMSAELALTEGCALPDEIPRERVRRKEIKELDRHLTALTTLETLRRTFQYREPYVIDPELHRTAIYRVTFDDASRIVRVESYSKHLMGADAYAKLQLQQVQQDAHGQTIILIEADTIDSLMEAYPNYFGDVTLFIDNLRKVTKGKDAEEYVLPPQRVVRPMPPEKPDKSWFRYHRKRRIGA